MNYLYTKYYKSFKILINCYWLLHLIFTPYRYIVIDLNDVELNNFEVIKTNLCSNKANGWTKYDLNGDSWCLFNKDIKHVYLFIWLKVLKSTQRINLNMLLNLNGSFI